MPSLKQCCNAFADMLEVGGAPDRAQQLRDHPREIGEEELAEIACALGFHPTQLFSAYVVRLAQTTGWMHPALAKVRLQHEGVLQ